MLICTDLMARGVDFKGVQMVVNYDLPQSAVSYIHRIGNTADTAAYFVVKAFVKYGEHPIQILNYYYIYATVTLYHFYLIILYSYCNYTVII